MKLYIRKIDEYADSDTELFEESRRIRLKRIKNPKVRTECIAAGMLLREALVDYGYPVGDNPLSIRYDENGKPELSAQADNPDNCKTAPFFSLSHSGNIVVCAVDDEPVGADVQVVKKVSVRLPKRVLSESELNKYQKLLTDGTEEDTRRYFTIRWTGKESIAKAKITIPTQYYTGKEITLDENSITVNLNKTDLVLGKDYVIVSYSDNVKQSSKAKVFIKGIGNYSGNLSKAFTIKKRIFKWWWSQP